MSGQVVDLLTARARRRRPVLEFDSPDAALLFCADLTADLQQRGAGHLFVAAEELDHQLAQVRAVLDELRRLWGEHRPDGRCCAPTTPEEANR